jgi:hypothetical protein
VAKKTKRTQSKGKREKVKYPSMKQQFNPRTRSELLNDIDYFNKLNDKEKDWMARFMAEFVGADFNHGGKILHKTKKLQKDCYSRNNSRNRDIMSIAKVTGKLDYLEEIKNKKKVAKRGE